MKRKQLKDEEYKAILQRHSPLYHYVISRYEDEAYNENREPVTVFGAWLHPLAIELSIFRYKTTFIADNYDDMETIKKDSEKFGGRLKDCFYFDYMNNIPPASITIASDIVAKFSSSKQFLEWVNLVMRRSRTLLISEKVSGYFPKISGGLETIVQDYPDKTRKMYIVKEAR